MQVPILTVTNIERTYPGKVPTHALRGVTLAVERGEFLAIMGRSGSGKSTLLRLLGLLDTPTSGLMVVDGKDMINISDEEKSRFRLEHLGYIFQEYALIVELSALENVYLPAMAKGGNSSNYIKRATELLTLVGLRERLHH